MQAVDNFDDWLRAEAADNFTCADPLSPDVFETRSRVHDWRNYVPTEIQAQWNSLTEHERLLVVVIAELSARAEIWG